jgi:hypothetical protein
MIEESFVRLYAHDFVQLAWRRELGQAVEEPLRRRIAEVRSHSTLMQTRKGADHLAAVIGRLREEAERFNPRTVQKGADPREAEARHRVFLLNVADRLLEAPPMAEAASMLRPVRRRR